MNRVRRLPVPYPVILAAGGIAIGLLPWLPHLRLSSAGILLLFVPPLVFEASLTFDQRQGRSVAMPIALLATAGVGMTVLCVGAGAHYLFGFGWPAALLLGAIVSPTDPIAVVAVIRQVGAHPRLAALLEGESLFNDGTGVAVFAAVAATIAGGRPEVADFGVRLLLLTAIGLAAGGVVGGICAAITHRYHPVAVPVAVVAAWASFLAAQQLGGSGVVAVVVAGFLVARFGLVTEWLLRPWAVLAFVLNALLFALVGLSLPTVALLALAAVAAGCYLLMLAARALTVWLLTIGAGLPWRWRQLAWWGGLRGALSIALALSVGDSRVSTVAYGMVVLSLLLQGGLLRPFARWSS
ncbi:MAG: cation:proton antiporter [Candidatus Dormibacteraeota bacterium]|nr:cation:proton antiporter [Candidatus Dormibacteraeota bacterium]